LCSDVSLAESHISGGLEQEALGKGANEKGKSRSGDRHCIGFTQDSRGLLTGPAERRSLIELTASVKKGSMGSEMGLAGHLIGKEKKKTGRLQSFESKRYTQEMGAYR